MQACVACRHLLLCVRINVPFGYLAQPALIFTKHVRHASPVLRGMRAHVAHPQIKASFIMH
jgi:hypothetical protein